MLLRRIARASLVVLFAGCGYDWTVGASDVADGGPGATTPTVDSGSQPVVGDGSTPTPSDASAAVDSSTSDGPFDASGVQECGSACMCANNQSCNFKCSKGTCAVNCTGNSECAVACAPSATCNINGAGTAHITADCSGLGTRCSLACTDKTVCNATCSFVSHCVALACVPANDCSIKCKDIACPQ